MVKISGNSLYAEPGDNLYNETKGFSKTKQIEDFCRDVLDKNFENWILVARESDPKNFNEVGRGNLLSGIVMCNVKKQSTGKPQKSNIKHLERKGEIAMMILDLLEGICEDGTEVENFLEALCETARHLHSRDTETETETEAEIEETSKNAAKLKILKGFLDTSINSFGTYEGKEKFLKSCLGSVIPARVLEAGTPELKAKLRKSMKATVAGDKEGGAFAMDTVDSVIGIVDAVLQAVDDGADTEGVLKVMRKFSKIMGTDEETFDKATE